MTLIKREDAIDVIWKCYPYGIEHSLFDEMEEKLRALPSATLPMNDLISRENAIDAVKKEIQDFEANYMHDEDDEEYGHDIGFVAGLHRAKTFIRSLPSAEAVQGWIPCSERLPSDANEVLACTDGVWVDIAKYNIGREEWYVIGKGEKNITAWMPLPKPYKGGDDE